MLVFDQVTSYLLVLALLTLFVAVFVRQSQGSQRAVVAWLAAGLLGILLGSAGSYAIMRTTGYQLTKVPQPTPAADETIAVSGAAEMSGMGPRGSGGMGMGGMGAGGMGMGDRFAPRPKRELTTLVRKLDLLTGDIAIALSDEQAKTLAESLKDVELADNMTDDDARAKNEQILSALDEDQKARLEAIGLPRRARSGPGRPEDAGPGGIGRPADSESTNPFAQEVEAKALNSLRERLVGPAATAEDKAKP